MLCETISDEELAKLIERTSQAAKAGMCQELLDTSFGEMWCSGEPQRQLRRGSLPDDTPGVKEPLRG